MNSLDMLKARRNKLDTMIIQIEDIEITIHTIKEQIKREMNDDEPNIRKVSKWSNEILSLNHLQDTMISKDLTQKEAMLFIDKNSK